MWHLVHTFGMTDMHRSVLCLMTDPDKRMTTSRPSVSDNAEYKSVQRLQNMCIQISLRIQQPLNSYHVNPPQSSSLPRQSWPAARGTTGPSSIPWHRRDCRTQLGDCDQSTRLAYGRSRSLHPAMARHLRLRCRRHRVRCRRRSDQVQSWR